MQARHKKQQGLTLISLIFILGIIGFFVLIALRVAPIYMEHGKVTHALETIKNRPDIQHQSKLSVWHTLNKQFGMNYIYHIKRKDVEITSRGGYLKVQIIYHVKQQFIGNLSIWVDFDNSIEVGTR